MALRINTNVTALNAHSNLVKNDTRLSSSIERISSGLRINRAADDPAGLTVSEKLRTQVRGIKRAQMNVQDGISLIQTAEGALNEVHSMLQRMRELALQSGNDTLTTTDRLEIQKEVAQLKDEINRVSYTTEFNTKKLLDGSGTALISSSSPNDLEGVVTGEVLTFSDFSIVVWPKSEYIPGEGQVIYDGSPEEQRSAIFLDLDGNIAEGSTTLQSISNFYDNNGTFILDIPQTLYLQGNNSQGEVVVSKDITLSQLTERIQSGMNLDQLGNGLNFEGSTASYLDSGENDGQINVTSGKNGEVGKVNFTGQENLVAALGFQASVEAIDPVYSVAVTNLDVPFSERKTTTTQISGHVASGLIEGIDLKFTPPQSAKVSTAESYVGITVPTDITFEIDDSKNHPAGLVMPLEISIVAGNYSMEQIAELVNMQISDHFDAQGITPTLKAELSENSSLQFSSVNTGSAAWVNITNATASNALGITNGTYTGTGGGSGSYTASGINNGLITTFDYTAVADNVVFSIADMHGKTVSITLDKDYTLGGVKDIAEDINVAIAAAGIAIQAEVVNGVLSFKSSETGFDSAFEVTSAAGGNLHHLGMVPGTSSGHYDGNPAVQNFAYDESVISSGFTVAGATPADDLRFTISDLDGNTMNISFPAGDSGYDLVAGTITAGGGDSFITTVSIANTINEEANRLGVKIHAIVDSKTNKLELVSDIPGKEGKIVITDVSDAASANNLHSVLGVESATYENGSGQHAYKMHVKDTSIQFQIGSNQGQTMSCNIIRTDIVALGIEDLDLTTTKSADAALGLIDRALQMVSSERSKLGAIQNRMTYTNNSLSVALQNTITAESQIRNVDMAAEIIEMTQAQILTQASNAMVGQANASAQNVLSLLQ